MTGRTFLVAAVLLLATALPRSSAAQDTGFAGRDSSAPIEITADELVVEQTRRTATFSGSVDAVQAGMRMTAQRLVVHYGEGAAGAAAGGTGQDRSIRRIEAFGDVFITASGETAQGRTGVYDVLGGQLTLEGDVVLTRAGNVIRGERLDVDLRTGQSTLKAAGQGRVRALFRPGGADGDGTEGAP